MRRMALAVLLRGGRHAIHLGSRQPKLQGDRSRHRAPTIAVASSSVRTLPQVLLPIPRQRAGNDAPQQCLHPRPFNRHGGSDPPASPASIFRSFILRESGF